MTTLLVGFDSAWTPGNAGAIAGVVRREDGSWRELGPPYAATFGEAEAAIRGWQTATAASRTVVCLDQPTVVRNARGQRPVEHLVASPVGLRYGGVQPASTARAEMFGADAPVWRFLAAFDPAQDPLARERPVRVLETYPVLAMIALGWTLPDRGPQPRATGRLPKYNPARRSTFAPADWRHVCTEAADAFTGHGLPHLRAWADAAGQVARPTKALQDGVDACVCLLVALALAQGLDGLLVGNADSGYMVVPHAEGLRRELETRCAATGRAPDAWVRPFHL